MDVHEFQAKELLTRFGIGTPRGKLADSVEGAVRAAHQLGGERFVVKAQILAGDRGPNGGVRFAFHASGVEAAAAALLGSRLATRQTPATGLPVKWVYVEEEIEAPLQLYAAVVLDHTDGRPWLLASRASGASLEQIARAQPHAIDRIPLTLSGGAACGDFSELARRIGLADSQATQAAQFFRRLATAFVGLDASLIEINPAAFASGDEFVALDAKLVIDDNALFRHPDLSGLKEFTVRDEGDPQELEAQRHQINYMRLDGDIGVMVNGAGLALATLDMLADAGGRPANFMDIRTTASSLDIAGGFALILENRAVRAILVNVHGGGMQACDTIAEGICIALRRFAGCVPPIVVRMAGNNAEFARTVLANSGVPHSEGTDMWDAVTKAVGLSSKEPRSWLSSLMHRRA